MEQEGCLMPQLRDLGFAQGALGTAFQAEKGVQEKGWEREIKLVGFQAVVYP